MSNQEVHRIPEWPTWLLIVFVYSAWMLLVSNFQLLHWAVGVPLVTLLLTLHSSLCHELIHGHPTGNQTINNLLGYPPLALIFPYTIFRETHLKHHRNEDITYPGIDPESFFCTEEAWTQMGKTRRWMAWVNMTLAGRMLMGPGTCICLLAKCAVTDLRTAPVSRKGMWVVHYSLVAGILVLVQTEFSIPAWQYLLMAYLSLSLIQLRSFFEHQPVTDVANRSVIQEASLPMSWLYLNNNYHYVHHQKPGLAWYRLKKEYQSNQAKYIAENGDFRYPGYSGWLRFAFNPVHSPVHPFYGK